MAAVQVDIKLRSIDKYIIQVHGSPRALTPDEDDYLERFAELITQAIRDNWPVDTGTSRDKWSVAITGRAGDVGFVVENEMWYAEFVHDELYLRLIPQIWNAIKENLIAGFKRVIDETERIYFTEQEAIEGIDYLERLVRSIDPYTSRVPR
jgi:hypothetical protein